MALKACHAVAGVERPICGHSSSAGLVLERFSAYVAIMTTTLNMPRITSNPDIMAGKPVIRGTRITVEIVLLRMADGYSMADLLEDWRHVEAQDIKAALDYAAGNLPRSIKAPA